ncbi:hypothetical protein [Nostoc flagelliforme]|nr:hypothetical protein [Nostoc flagelliforme]
MLYATAVRRTQQEAGARLQRRSRAAEYPTIYRGDSNGIAGI